MQNTLLQAEYFQAWAEDVGVWLCLWHTYVSLETGGKREAIFKRLQCHSVPRHCTGWSCHRWLCAGFLQIPTETWHALTGMGRDRSVGPKSMWVTVFAPSGLQATDCFNKNIVAESTYVKKYFYCLNSQVSKSIKMAWNDICPVLFPYVASAEGKKQSIF